MKSVVCFGSYTKTMHIPPRDILVLCSSIDETGEHDGGNGLDTKIPLLSNTEKLTAEVETRGNSG